MYVYTYIYICVCVCVCIYVCYLIDLKLSIYIKNLKEGNYYFSLFKVASAYSMFIILQT